MRLGLRPPMLVWAAALIGLIVLLAALQYRWLGQISTAERERMKASLTARAAGLAQDFDREVTRAYLTFQMEPMHEAANLAARTAERFDRWHETSRYPRLIEAVYLVPQDAPSRLQRFDPDTRLLEPVEWPERLRPIQDALAPPEPAAAQNGPVIRTMPSALWEAVPAIVAPAALLVFNTMTTHQGQARQEVTFAPAMSYTILALDRDYVANDMLPALAQQHLRGAAEEPEYQVAVVSAAGVIFSNAAGFAPDSHEGDAAADLFQVRPQDFGPMVAEIRRLTSFLYRAIEPPSRPGGAPQRGGAAEPRGRVAILPPPSKGSAARDPASLPIIVQQNGTAMDRRPIETRFAAIADRAATQGSPRWRLVVKHPSGSLERAVAQARRRNLLVSSGILAILSASIGFLVVSTRRAQMLASQQMEFVATVSHELRTPLAVIRSAGDNLADGVVHDEAQVRKYGALVRNEGRRLTDMVEQILEFAGIQSGQRTLSVTRVHLQPLLANVLSASAGAIETAAIRVDIDVPSDLPPVAGDEAALRRVFHNLIGNAIKYGAAGRWIGITARASAAHVSVSVSDRGIGIALPDQSRIFEPFYRASEVVAAQIQGAGLGLSLVHRIVRAHRGRVEVKSAKGQGSELIVHLPLASEQMMDAAPELSGIEAARSEPPGTTGIPRPS